MKTISRRKFIGTSAMGALAVSSLPLESFKPVTTPFNWPLSFQSWGVKDSLAKDFDNTLRKIQALGYKGVEMCSPVGYKDSGFGPLTKLTVTELRQKIENAGLFCKTCHFNHIELKGDNLQKTIAWGKDLGLHDIVLSGAALGEDATLDEWKQVAEELNKAAVKVRDAGLQLVYHNHTIGPEINGEQLYDLLMGMFDPDLIKMQFQIACISEGFDVIAYLAKYSGRYISLHMHDWDPVQKKIVPLGQGIVNWKKLIKTARQSGIADYGLILELESRPPDDPVKGLAVSYTYLNNLKIK
jgi:sugar phosphate isomerase/epimerase